MKIPIKRQIKKPNEQKQEDNKELAIEEALQSLGEGDGFERPSGIKVATVRRIASKLGIRIESYGRTIRRKKTVKLNHLYEDTLKGKIWDLINKYGFNYCFQCGKTDGMTQSHRTNRPKIGKTDYAEWCAIAPICLNPCHIEIEQMTPTDRYNLMTLHIKNFVSKLEAEGVIYDEYIAEQVEKYKER